MNIEQLRSELKAAKERVESLQKTIDQEMQKESKKKSLQYKNTKEFLEANSKLILENLKIA